MYADSFVSAPTPSPAPAPWFHRVIGTDVDFRGGHSPVPDLRYLKRFKAFRGSTTKVFLSHAFRDEERELVARVEQLLSSQDVRLVTGRRLGGGQLTPQVMQRIEDSHGLIALMTRRETLGNPQDGRWSTHQWVVDELNHARGQQIPAIALVEHGVELGGAYQQHERIPLDLSDPLDAFLALSETLRIWKRNRGFTRLAYLLPNEVSSELRSNRSLVCRYRCVSTSGETSDWMEGEPLPGQGGTLLYLTGIVDDTAQVQVEILDGNQPRWWSELTPQSINVELRQAE